MGRKIGSWREEWKVQYTCGWFKPEAKSLVSIPFPMPGVDLTFMGPKPIKKVILLDKATGISCLVTFFV
ncbi:unnamed protein product [Urochloa humidicola]